VRGRRRGVRDVDFQRDGVIFRTIKTLQREFWRPPTVEEHHTPRTTGAGSANRSRERSLSVY
jgi:hypothetical protein